ncbi:MAG: ribosome maturation factor RimM [Bacteroidota bacterium]
MTAYITIGKTGKTHGVQGELKVHIEEEYLEDFARAEVLYLSINGKPIPYFVEGLRSAAIPLVRLDEVETKEAAQRLVGKDILLPEEQLLKEEEREWEVETLEFEFLSGYRLFEVERGEIGTIEEVVEFPQQEMAVVNYEGRELFIPLNEQLIEQIDEGKRTIHLRLPEGLLDL